jgi:hypothetical protein
MKYKIALLTILVISICLSLFGFLVDSDPSNPNVMTTVFELAMMTVLVFVILTTLYFTATYTFKKVKQLAS